jgi:hypothetical protein
MKIRVKSEENELEITLDINEKEHTVYDLKELIAKHNFGLSIKEQRLEFIKNGMLRRLKNSHFIEYYEINEGSILILKHQSASSSSSNSSSPYASDVEIDYKDE